MSSVGGEVVPVLDPVRSLHLLSSSLLLFLNIIFFIFVCFELLITELLFSFLCFIFVMILLIVLSFQFYDF